MATYLTELIDRAVAMQIEAMASISVTVDAKPMFWHTQESFPYFTNRIADNPISDDGSQDEDLNQPILIMRFVVAHITAGYKGEKERNLYEWLPVIKTWFNEHMWLTSVAYPLRMNDLQSARIVNNGGIRAFENVGIPTVQVGSELQLACIFPEYIDQVQY